MALWLHFLSLCNVISARCLAFRVRANDHMSKTLWISLLVTAKADSLLIAALFTCLRGCVIENIQFGKSIN